MNTNTKQIGAPPRAPSPGRAAAGRAAAVGAAGRAAAVIAAAVVIAALAGCKRAQNDAAAAAAAAPSTPVYAVNTMLTVRGQIRDYLSLSGDIVAGSTVDAYPDAAGRITRIDTAVGQRISRGAVIAWVDPSKPGMEYKPSAVKAPVAGTVVALPAQVGMTVSQAVSLARISAGADLEIRLYVAERFISKVALGQVCDITLDAFPDEVFQGEVTEVSPTVDPASRTMEVTVRVDDPGARLKAGMFAKVRIYVEEKSGVVKIPASALIQRFGEDYVFTAEPEPGSPGGYVARKKPVVPGIQVDGVMEVRNGLAPNEDVVVRGQSQLDDGARVNVVDRLAPLSAD